MTALTKSVVTLGGREFTVIDFERRTIAIDLYLHRVMRESRLDRVLPEQEEEVEAYIARIQSAVIDCGRAQELIAGHLVPDGGTEHDWTPAVAAETTRHIGSCNTAEDREIVVELCSRVVFGFFRQWLDQLERSQRSLAVSPLTSGGVIDG